MNCNQYHCLKTCLKFGLNLAVIDKLSQLNMFKIWHKVCIDKLSELNMFKIWHKVSIDKLSQLNMYKIWHKFGCIDELGFAVDCHILISATVLRF